MPIRFSISPWLRLPLLLAIWLGSWLCPATPVAASRQAPQQLQAGHQPHKQQPELTVAHLQEQAALLPAVPDVPTGASNGALLPIVFGWPEFRWPLAAGVRLGEQACAVPDLFRVRLLLTALSPNAP